MAMILDCLSSGTGSIPVSAANSRLALLEQCRQFNHPQGLVVQRFRTSHQRRENKR